MACANASPLSSPSLPTSLFASAPPSFPCKTSKERRSRWWIGAYGLHAPDGGISSRTVWMTYLHKRIKLRLLAFRLSQEKQEKAERRTKRKASKNQRDGCSQIPCISRDG